MPAPVTVKRDSDVTSADTVSASTVGHGLRGMRERAAAAGGTIDVGPLPAGGFRVTATLPLNTQPAVKATGTTPTQKAAR
jgi:signal transduction histidine kinase